MHQTFWKLFNVSDIESKINKGEGAKAPGKENNGNGKQSAERGREAI